jgi:general nucleoside transport system ATP-binding protein
MRDAVLSGTSLACGYGEQTVLHGVSLALYAGEIHAVLGENGAGKSTLLKVLSGSLPYQAGRIEAFESTIEAPTVRSMKALGVAMVQQHFALQPSMTAVENVMLSADQGTFLRPALARSRLASAAKEFGFALSLDVPVSELSLGDQQRIEIVRAYLEGGKVLILDEPTAVLTPRESEALYASLVRLKNEAGVSICIVTHRLDEVVQYADRVTVLRKGALVYTQAGKTPRDALATFIMGALPEQPPERERTSIAEAPETQVLQLESVTTEVLRQVSLTVHAGEILGVAGIDGNGQSDLVRVASGRQLPQSGRVAKASTHALVPENRQTEGLVLDASVLENLVLGELASFSRYGLLDSESIQKEAALRMARVDSLTSLSSAAKTLSGGNQQKVVVARALARAACAEGACMVVSNPTRGVDIGAAQVIHEALLEVVKAHSVGILLVSADLDELRLLSDRIVVLRDGAVCASFSPTASPAEIGDAMIASGATP